MVALAALVISAAHAIAQMMVCLGDPGNWRATPATALGWCVMSAPRSSRLTRREIWRVAGRADAPCGLATEPPRTDRADHKPDRAAGQRTAATTARRINQHSTNGQPRNCPPDLTRPPKRRVRR